jgi:hypothetical protein
MTEDNAIHKKRNDLTGKWKSLCMEDHRGDEEEGDSSITPGGLQPMCPATSGI